MPYSMATRILSEPRESLTSTPFGHPKSRLRAQANLSEWAVNGRPEIIVTNEQIPGTETPKR